MKNSERIPSIIFFLLSLFVCQQSIGYGIGTLRQPGPGFLAFSAGTGMGVFALWLLVQSLLSKEQQDKGAGDEKYLKNDKFILISLSLFGYAIAVVWFGFLFSTFIFIIFILRIVESEKWWRTLLTAAFVTIGNYMLFVGWLDLSLPEGIFFR